MKESLFGKTLDELKEVVQQLNLPAFSAKQIAEWLYTKNISSITEMTNLSLKARSLLDEKYTLGLEKTIQVQESVDGTKKYLFKANKSYIETAYIPEEKRKTLCVSSQVGCKMACLFCMTGKQGFQGNLSAGEILNQLRSIPEFHEVSNMVYMGMGEPFDNLSEVLKSLDILTAPWGMAMSPRRITVSSIGIVPALKEFLTKSECHLAISLHTPFNEERAQLMPIENVYPVEQVVEEIRHFDFGLQRRVSFEYIVFEGLNDSPAHVTEMARLLNGIRCRINLIRFHAIPDSPLRGTTQEKMEAFRDALKSKGLFTSIRKSRGEDIYAACGLLSTKELVKKDNPDF